MSAATNSSALVLSAPDSGTNTTAIAELHDIRPPVDIPSALTWLWWTLLILAVLAAAYFAIRHWLKNRPEEEKAKRVIPPHDRARKRLEAALKHMDDPRLFCTLVSDAVREYLEERFEHNAPDRTTEEFLEELKLDSALSVAQKNRLAEFLMQCDLAKFAKLEHETKELQQLYDLALQLIKDTEPLPTAAPGARVQAPATSDEHQTAP